MEPLYIIAGNNLTPTMKNKSPSHLLLRFSDSLLKSGDTIAYHNLVIEREGAVWFGKMGSPVSQDSIDILNIQVQQGIPTFVYLVKGNRSKSTAYRGRLVVASKTLLVTEKHLVPGYYAELNIHQYVKFWVKLSEIIPIDMVELQKMQVSSSVLPIQETLFKSSSGHFLVREAK
jgi:hypothetical protein